MTTGTMTREDTGSFAPVRLHTAQPSHGNPLTGWMPPSSWADEPTPLHDAMYADEQPISEAHALAQIDYARSLVGYEDARHRWASERDLQTWCAQTTATWVPAVEQYRPRSVSELFNEEQYRRLRDNPQLLPAPEVLLAKLPEPPEKQLAPEVLDAEHQQRQADREPEPAPAVNPRLTDKWKPAPEPQPETRADRDTTVIHHRGAVYTRRRLPWRQALYGAARRVTGWRADDDMEATR